VLISDDHAPLSTLNASTNCRASRHLALQQPDIQALDEKWALALVDIVQLAINLEAITDALFEGYASHCLGFSLVAPLLPCISLTQNLQ
jgi:hypothetical protein